ncbi:hypothetical protein DPMN_006507 [Dreissena polymorpha]|uniref:Elongation of very long chain fatty acids protein n=1 Tax=Dreissena polymorpha TaxID=45954 RepID=A0A9D4MVC0_DREPO|nr:hypothetical protein DPMN_006507 [Dreissena polymorpha]
MEYWRHLYTKATLPDPRTQEWLLIPNIAPNVVIVATYLIVIIGGQKVMRNREAFQLNQLMMVYNFCLVLLNAYIFYEFLMSAWFNLSFSKVCAPVGAGQCRC